MDKPPSSKNYPKFIIAGLILLIAVSLGGYYLVKSNSKSPLKACTMEAKLCPDGSSVGRTGPNCDFAPCPNSVSQECGVCGPEGMHNVNGAVCAEGLVCKKGITTSLSYCVKQDSSTETCENN